MSETTRELPWQSVTKKQTRYDPKTKTQWANRMCVKCRKAFFIGPHDLETAADPVFALCPVCEPSRYPDRVQSTGRSESE